VSGAFGLMDVLRAAGLRYAGRGPNFVAGELRAPTKHADRSLKQATPHDQQSTTDRILRWQKVSQLFAQRWC